MFLEERMEILSRISEVKGILKTIRDFLGVYYPEDKSIDCLFESVDVELDEAKSMSLGVYGTWGLLSSVFELESSNVD